MRKLEQKFITEFQKWIKHNSWNETFAFEAKIATKNKFYFNQIAEHQLRNLLLAKQFILPYKISDYDQMYKPFDGFVLQESGAYFLIKWEKSKKFYVIDVEVMQKLIQTHEHGITKEQAEEASFKVGNLA